MPHQLPSIGQELTRVDRREVHIHDCSKATKRQDSSPGRIDACFRIGYVLLLSHVLAGTAPRLFTRLFTTEVQEGTTHSPIQDGSTLLKLPTMVVPATEEVPKPEISQEKQK